MSDLIIIGSGVAGHRAAAEISRLAPDRPVHVIGDEPVLPYDRPPLSKNFIMAKEPVPPFLGPSGLYGQNINLREGIAATRIDRKSRSVTLSDGDRLNYDMLLLATGSRLRRLPLPDIDPQRIHYLRTIEDARRLRAALLPKGRVAIIGGGFIGLEVAAAARTIGCAVTVFEAASALLSRGSTQILGGYMQAVHAARGVDIVLDARIEHAVEGRDGVRLRWWCGEVSADLVVVGVGVQPNTTLAADAGLDVDDGIIVDESGRTSDPSIFAAGEVTSYPIGRLGVRMRTESWSAASIQGEVAARTMLGVSAGFFELPWFWSDQYDVNVQCLGLPKTAHRFMQINDLASGKWLRIGVDCEGKLVGAEGVNMGREISALRRADRSGQPIPRSLVDMADTDVERTESRVPAGSTSLAAGIE